MAIMTSFRLCANCVSAQFDHTFREILELLFYPLLYCGITVPNLFILRETVWTLVRATQKFLMRWGPAPWDGGRD